MTWPLGWARKMYGSLQKHLIILDDLRFAACSSYFDGAKSSSKRDSSLRGRLEDGGKRTSSMRIGKKVLLEENNKTAKTQQHTEFLFERPQDSAAPFWCFGQPAMASAKGSTSLHLLATASLQRFPLHNKASTKPPLDEPLKRFRASTA